MPKTLGDSTLHGRSQGSRALVHAKLVQKQRRLEFSFVTNSLDDAAFVQSLVNDEGGLSEVKPVIDVGLESSADTVRKLSGGELVATYLVSGATSVTMLAAALMRLVQGLRRGVIIRFEPDGKSNISRSDDLPRGVVVVVDEHDRRAEISGMASDAMPKLVQALRRGVKPKQR